MRIFLVAVAVGTLAVTLSLPADGRAPTDFPAPKSVGPVETYGANLRRSMTMMATSTARKRNTVRVLFYGQSITADAWTFQVAERLRRQYPLVDFAIENRAIGGFNVERLVKTAEADLYPFYPDLVIFHAYGGAGDYEAVVRRIRERTTADILIATDHVAPQIGETMNEETDPSKLRPPRADEPAAPWRSFAFLPMIAKKYGAELADVRRPWKQYIADFKLSPSDLLRDGLHLNDRGNFLMAQIIAAHLRHRPDLPDDGWSERVKTYTVGPEGDIDWKDGKLVLPFEGNKVDLICGEGTAPPAAIRIDGKKPSAFPELYSPTRAEMVVPRSRALALTRVRAEKPLIVEDWTIRITDMDSERRKFKFQVVGSVTGDDGQGESDKRFVSKSGRVVIEPDDFYLDYALQVSTNRAARAVECRWSVAPMFADAFVVPAARNPFGDTVVVSAQGLSNGKHTLEITGSPETPIAAIRVYRPPLR